MRVLLVGNTAVLSGTLAGLLAPATHAFDIAVGGVDAASAAKNGSYGSRVPGISLSRIWVQGTARDAGARLPRFRPYPDRARCFLGADQATSAWTTERQHQ